MNSLTSQTAKWIIYVKHNIISKGNEVLISAAGGDSFIFYCLLKYNIGERLVGGLNMFRAKVFVAVKDKKLSTKVKQILVRDGNQIVGEADDGNAAIRMVRATTPDLIIADADLPGLGGLDIAKITYEDNVAPSVVLLNNWQLEHIEKKEAEPWMLAWLIKPVTDTNLITSIGVALRNYKRIQELEKEIAQLKETIETRKLIDRAKGILMETKNISEGEAYKLLRRQSMNKCISMGKVAEAIILAHEIGG